jgi:meiotically up-regulated gene 157 (Mug157) protein
LPTPSPTPDPDPHCNHGHSGPAPSPPTHPLPRVRPAVANRSFVSPAVERALERLVTNRTWHDPELATLFWNCMPNTLDTTVWQAPDGSDPRPTPRHAGGDSSFVSTGDQASMYLRDSQNQVLPYVRFAAEEPNGVGLFLRGILKRYTDSVLLDPYANSFDYTAADKRCNPGAWTKDNTTEIDPATGKRVNGMKPGIHQRKWEMDSLASVLKLSRLYHAGNFRVLKLFAPAQAN